MLTCRSILFPKNWLLRSKMKDVKDRHFQLELEFFTKLGLDRIPVVVDDESQFETSFLLQLLNLT